MSLVIGLLRIVVGIIVLGLTGKIYLEHHFELAGTKNILIDYYGFRFDIHWIPVSGWYQLECDPRLVVLGLIIGGLIGVLALCAGLHAVSHWPERSREDDRPKAAAPKAAASSDGTT
jgi:hypothetical protein